MRERQCIVCGRTFAPAPPKHAAKTCSPECALKLKKKRDRKWARKAYQKRRHSSGTTGVQIPWHKFPCPWETGSITAPECLGVDPWLGF